MDGNSNYSAQSRESIVVEADFSEQDKVLFNMAVTKAKEEAIRQIQLDKESFTMVFGLFASLLSFLTIEFQLFKSLYSWQKILGFSSLLCALILIFNLTLSYFLQTRKDAVRPWDLYVIIAFLFVVGIGFASCGNEEAIRKTHTYQRAYKVFQEEQGKLYRSYDQKLDGIFSDVRKMKHEIEELKVQKALDRG